ncbi:coil containing protein [Vibrio phage 1.253.O._10N.286.45.B12]|nr:coil containing protein [Vibrio phage 1.235.O._10N.261.52.B2]AUR98562.1 coil containing protein [Vibrio phage 1.253.O._10N.286.45.B12]
MNTILNVLKTAAVGDMLKYTGTAGTGRLFTVGKDYPVVETSDGRLSIVDNQGMNPPAWWDHPRYTFELIKKAETPTVFGDLSRDEQIKLMSAKLDGKDIEFFNKGLRDWSPIVRPSWAPEYAYRIHRTAEEIEMDELREKLEVFNKQISGKQGEMNRLNNAGGRDFDCLSREQQGALLLAHHNGERIQYKSGWLSTFVTFDEGVTPEWDDDTVYRVEPAEVASLKVEIDHLSSERDTVQARIDDLNKPVVEVSVSTDDVIFVPKPRPVARTTTGFGVAF